MKRSRLALRRVLAVVAGAAIGLVGTVALASPASAHHSEVQGSYYCDTKTGEWVVTWTVTASQEASHFKLVDVNLTPEGSTVTNIAVTEGQRNFPHPTGVPLVGEQRLSGEHTSASLEVRAKWSNRFEERQLRRGEVTFEGTCEKEPEPGPIQVTDVPSCDELAVTVTNPEDGAETTVSVVTDPPGEETVDLAPGASETFTFPAVEGLTYQVIVEGSVIAEGGWEDPGDCEVEIPVAHLSDCDSLTVEVTNPLEDESIEATITSGDETETLTIAPGESGEVTFDAEEGTVATVTIAGGDAPLEIAWEEPEDCDGEGGGLPVTGSSTGLVAGAAIALLVLGAGMFLVARRRRITFTS